MTDLALQRSGGAISTTALEKSCLSKQIVLNKQIASEANRGNQIPASHASSSKQIASNANSSKQIANEANSSKQIAYNANSSKQIVSNANSSVACCGDEPFYFQENQK